ncbi:MAG: ArsR family transcriptional regulator [Halorientalis sp.]
MTPPLAPWMTPVDRDILAVLRNGECQELILTPGVIAANTDWKRQTVREHLLTLIEHDFVKYHDQQRALYQLSERGRAYLRGDIDLDAEIDD